MSETNPQGAGRLPLATHADILAALMWGQKTVGQLAEEAGASEQVVRRWLRSLHASGVVYMAERRPLEVNPETGRRRTGNRDVLYALQPTPYAMTDAPIPQRTIEKRLYRARKQARAQQTQP